MLLERPSIRARIAEGRPCELDKMLGLKIPFAPAEGRYERYCGDTSVPGKGEILVWRPSAS